MSEEIKELYKGKWTSVHVMTNPDMKVEGYEYAHQERGGAQAVCIVPAREVNDDLQILLHREWTPAWMVHQKEKWKTPFYNSITGALEDVGPEQSAMDELRQECGYSIEKKDLVSLGTVYMYKACDAMCHVFTCDLTGIEQGKLEPDSELEKLEKPEWVSMMDTDIVLSFHDPLIYTAITRMMAMGLV